MTIAPPKSALPPLSPDLIARLTAIVGDKYAVTDADELAQYLTEARNLFHGRSPLVLRPASTAEVSAICKLASEYRIALVPQGGNTGLVGGQTPHNGEVVVSMRRMDKIREVDTASNTMTVEAGEAAPSAAISRPMPEAPARWHTAWLATWRSVSKWCCPTDASSTTCPS
jgi:D-lactate dehydrogenase (cytochrome)